MNWVVRSFTASRDVNDMLGMLADELPRTIGDRLVGLYLTGSLASGEFDPGSSDVDFLVILDRELSDSQRTDIRQMHAQIAAAYPHWSARIEGSYITRDMLDSVDPPQQPRPYVNVGQFWDPDPRFGHEWLINLLVLRETGAALLGPDPKAIVPPVDIKAVREASRRDLHEEWAPKLREPSPFDRPGYDSSHLQAYAVLTMCRILYLDKHDGVASKRTAADWVKTTYGRPWDGLVEKAVNWQHAQHLDEQEQTLRFIEFVMREVG